MSEIFPVAMAIMNAISYSFAWSRLVIPFGITTLSLVVLTACTGLFMRKKPKLLFGWHKRLAFAAVFAGACHAMLVILF